MKVVIFCYLLAFCCCLAAAESVPCEIIVDNTCHMTGLTVIDSPGVLISSTADTSIRTLRFNGNKKIKFLPLNASEKFPSLEGYEATSCSIETITKENFKALSKLKFLFLNNNKIEKVPSDAFEGLIALETIWLDYNQIKFINSAAFRGLSNLRDIDLRGNVCIQESYHGATSITSMIHTLTDKCGFYENPLLDDFSRKTSDQVNKISESLTSIRKEQQEQGSTSNSLTRETKAEIKAEIVKSRNESAKSFASFEAELQTAKAQIGELQSEGQRHHQENVKLLTQVQDLMSKFADLEKIEVRKETELKILREQNRKCDDEVKVNLETMKAQMQFDFNQLMTTTNETAMCHKLIQSCAGKLTLCERELNQKQANNEMLQASVTELQIAKAQTKSEMRSAEAEKVKNLNQIDQQATTIAYLTTQNKVLSNEFKKENHNLEECEREKAKLDVDLKLANSNLDVFKGIDIGKFREEIRQEFVLLRNSYTGRAQVN